MNADRGRRVDPDHDGRAVGQVEAAHDAENQREPETEQRVGRAEHDPVDEVLQEI